jgi:hypothetical protein
MAEKITPDYIEDLKRYQYANVAARLLSNEEDAHFAKGALEKLLDEMSPADKGIAEGFYQGAFASEEGIKIAAKINAKKYDNARGKLSIGEFYEVRFNIIKSILGEDKAKEAKTVFDKYSEQTVGSILKKVAQADEKIQNKSGIYNEKEFEEAKKTLDKLKYMNNIINLIEQRNYEELRNGATKNTYKELISESLKAA